MIPIISVINLAIGAGSIYVAADIYLHIYKHTKSLEYFYFSLMFLFSSIFFFLVGSPGIFTTSSFIIQYNFAISIFFPFLALASIISVIELIYTKYPAPIIFWVIAIMGAIDTYVSIKYALPAKVQYIGLFSYYLPNGSSVVQYLNGVSIALIILGGTSIFWSSYIHLRKIDYSSAHRSLLFVIGGLALFVAGEAIYFWYPYLQIWNMWCEVFFSLIWVLFFGYAVLKKPAQAK